MIWRSVPSPILIDEFQLNLLLGVVTAVSMKNSVSWDVGPHSPVNSISAFEEHIASIFRVELVFTGLTF
jgi:hypothetical protein